MPRHTIDENRLYWIDVIRSFACLCVITTHAPIPGGSGGEWLLAPRLYLAKSGASILFFMISGALVLYRPKSLLPFIRVRLSRVVLPMVVWSLISLAIHLANGYITLQEFALKVASIPFVPQVRIYWFIYVILGIYLLTPILSTWLERCSKRDLQVYLGLWGACLCVPWFAYLYPPLHAMIIPGEGSLYYFTGYLWCAVAGYYLRRWGNIERFRLVHALTYALLLAMPGLLFLTPIPHALVQNNLAPSMVALCCCHFLLLKNLHYPAWLKRAAYQFARHSFGIYLVHILVKSILAWLIIEPLHLHYAVQIPLTVALTAALSYLLVHLLSKLPASKYIIGL